MAHNHEQLERAHSICLASHQGIIAAIEFPLAAHELLFSPHIFVWVTSTPANDVIREGIDNRRSLIRGQFPVVGQNLYNPLSIDSPSSLSSIHFI